MDKDKILIVGYGSEARMVTTDRKEAHRALCHWMKESPVLDWGIRTINEALSQAWSDGYDDSDRDHAELDAGIDL